MSELQSNNPNPHAINDTRHISLWLLPDASHQPPWARLIAELARQNSSPIFDPHVSLQVGEQAAGIDLPELLRWVASDTAPIELPVLCIDHGEAYFKSVFARVPGETVSVLSAELSVAMSDPEAFILDPHLSLVYANLDLDERENLCRSISVPTERVTFDQIALVEPGDGEFDFARVDRWHVTDSVRLTG